MGPDGRKKRVSIIAGLRLLAVRSIGAKQTLSKGGNVYN